MIERLLRGIGGALGVRVAVRLLRDVAEGKRGPTPQRVYLFLAGKKRVTAALLGLVAAVIAGAGYPQEALLVGTVGGVLYSLGFLDKAWRDYSPVFVELREYELYRVLADNAATVTTILATAWAYVQAGHCFGYDCDLVAKVLLGAGAGLAYLGVADAAWKAKPPAITPTRR